MQQEDVGILTQLCENNELGIKALLLKDLRLPDQNPEI
jgi:hypothetical protein